MFPGSAALLSTRTNNLFVSAHSVFICAIAEHSSEAILHPVTEVHKTTLNILGTGIIFVLKCVTAGGLVRFLSYMAGNHQLFLLPTIWGQEIRLICVCRSPGAIYCSRAEPGSLTCSIFFILGFYFASAKTLMLRDNNCRCRRLTLLRKAM